MSEWIEIGPISEIPQLGARIIRREGGDIAIFRTSEDEIFALDDSCPHKGGPLSQGIVHDCRVTCPLHNWVLELKTGEAVAPDEGRVRSHAVELRDGIVFLSINSADIEQKGAA
ncbi:MAG: tRNA-(guanine-N1)-methyltransferase [Rhodomicrobium sp.]|nr:MAG: tRNA-(guanine-N1)-methyltransferase [Rhodomicrobium sp.]